MALARPVEVRITGESRSAVSAINRTDSSLRQLHDTAGKTHGGLGRLKSALVGLGAGAAAFSFLKSSAKAAGDFEQQTNILAAALGKTGAAAESAKTDLGALAKELGASTVFSTKDAAEGMTELAKAGLSLSQIKAGGIQSVLDLAATEGMALGDAAKVAASSMTTFGLAAKDMPAIADALAGASASSTASVSSLAFGLSQVGPGAKIAGASLQETVGALAALEQSGIKGQDAGTSLKTFFTRLVPQTDRARDAFADLGLWTEDAGNKLVKADGSMLSITKTAGLLAKGLKDMPESERIEALSNAFGSDAARAAAALGSAGAKGLEKYIKATRDKMAAERLSEARTKGYNGAIERLSGAFDTLKIAVGEKYRGAITGVANQLSEVVLPAITKFVEGIDTDKLKAKLEGIIPALKEFGRKVKEAFAGSGISTDDAQGAVAGIKDALAELGDLGARAFSAFGNMSPEAKKNIALIIAAGGAFALAKRNPVVKIGVDLVAGVLTSVASTVASSLTGKLFPDTVKIAGVPRVYVTNMPLGGPDGGGPGGGGGRPRGAQVGLGIAAVAAAVLPMLIDRLPFSQGFKDSVSHISESVALGSSAAWVATALGVSNPIGWAAGLTLMIGKLSLDAQRNQTAWAHQDYVNNGVAGEMRTIRTGMYGLDKQQDKTEHDVIAETKGRRAGDEREANRRSHADISEAERRLFADRSEADKRRNADAHLTRQVAHITADMATVRAYFHKVERLVAEDVMAPAPMALSPRAAPALVQNFSINVSGAGNPAVTARQIDRYIRRAGDPRLVSVTA